MTAYAIRKMIHQDQVYTPVVAADGRILQPVEVERLNKIIDHTKTIRQCEAVLLDESPMPTYPATEKDLRIFQKHNIQVPIVVRYQFAGWTAIESNIPVLIGGSDFCIATLEAVSPVAAGKIDGVVGACLIGTIRFHRTLLANITFDGIRDGVLTGVCLELAKIKIDGDIGIDAFKKVHLGDSSSACCKAAKVIRTWETSESGASPISKKGDFYV